jgi:hypothetical protein
MRIKKSAGIILLLCILVFGLLRFYVQYKKSNHDTYQSGQTFNRNAGHLVLTKHAQCRMQCREINEEEIKEILHDGNINYNESNLNEPRGPRFALEGYSHDHQHLRVIFVPEKDAIIVITCIDLDKEWPCPACN